MLRDVPAVQPTRRRPREQVRADLLNAAERLVRTRGFRVSVDEIAAEAGMTKGAVYSNFANRAELMESVAERVQPAPVLLDEQVPADLSVGDAWEWAASELAQRVDEQPQDWALLLDLLAEFAREPELLRRARESPVGHQAAEVLQARADREGRALPRAAEDLVIVLDALALGLGATRLVRGRQAVPDELFVWAFRRIVQDAAG